MEKPLAPSFILKTSFITTIKGMLPPCRGPAQVFLTNVADRSTSSRRDY
jgi:hypothetical protein